MRPFSLASRCFVGYNLFLLGCLLLGLSVLPALGQTTRYVTTTGTNASPATATTWASSTTDLQGAINASASGDQVWVATGTYKPTTTASRTVSFAMKAGVAIYGGFAGTENLLTDRPAINPPIDQPSSTTLSGNIGTPGTVTDNSYHVINNPEGLTSTAILDGFVITGGQADGGGTGQKTGAGMLNNGSTSGKVCSPTIRNCLFQGNATISTGGGNGGAMFNNGSSGGNSNPTITNCAFLNNSAYVGGAINDDGGFSSGTASPVITNCLFQGNTVTSGGGAIFNNAYQGNASPTLTNCSFLNNTANIGGALFNDGRPDATGISAPQLTNCSFQGNTASSQGGAMYTNNTSGVVLVVTNCVFFANTVVGGFGPALTATYSLFSQSVSGTGNINNVSVNPFVSTSSNMLRTGSPAINVGNNAAYTAAGGPVIDLANNTRIVGTAIDMGAYEFGSYPLPVTLRYFNGRMTESGALLGWATAREDNNARFQIERSRNITAFESIATIPSQAPGGNSVTELTYSFTDTQPLPGVNYYRLVQTDRDGTRTTSKIVALSRENAPPVLFPNPVSAAGEASIEPAISHTGYTISDVLGRMVRRVEAAGVLSRVSLVDLPAGVYLLVVQTEAGPKTFRLIR